MPSNTLYPTSADAALHNGKFTDGIPTEGVPASRVQAQTLNLLLDNLESAIRSAGLTPDNLATSQLLAVLQHYQNLAEGDATSKANNAKSQAISAAAGDATSKANNAKREAIELVYPIGFVYWQLPGKKDPQELHFVGGWQNISNEFPGDFFRAEGGNASAFNGGRQGDATAVNGLSTNYAGNHNHSMDSSGNHKHSIRGHHASAGGMEDTADTRESTYYGSTHHVINSAGDHRHSINYNGNHRHTLSGDSETRPPNRTIRLWERVN